MNEAHAAKCLRELRANGYQAHLHPVTQRVAVWLHGRWWHVAGGSFQHPSLIAAKEQAPGPTSTRERLLTWDAASGDPPITAQEISDFILGVGGA